MARPADLAAVDRFVTEECPRALQALERIRADPASNPAEADLALAIENELDLAALDVVEDWLEQLRLAAGMSVLGR